MPEIISKRSADQPSMCVTCGNFTPVTETTGTCAINGPISKAVADACKLTHDRIHKPFKTDSQL